jgi:hypothetical protein
MSDADRDASKSHHERRSMDPHLACLETRLDLIDDNPRGDTAGRAPGLVESVRLLSSEQRRQGEELGLLRNVPAQLDALTRAGNGRDGQLEELAEKVDRLISAQARAIAVKEGERAAMDRLSKWLKIGAGVGAAMLAGGGVGTLALLRQIAEVVQAIP